jgi:hypothetical protein
MKQILWALLFVSSVLFGQTSLAQESEEEISLEQPGGCPVLCNAYEACIEHRCVETCRIGCRPGTYCTASGECRPMPQPKEPALTEAERQRLAGRASADLKTVLFGDLGGIAGFGLALGFEHGQQNSILLRARALNTGVMSHAVYAENEYERFEWGFGGSVGMRHYEATWGNLRGFYYGGGVDYSVIRLMNRVRASDGHVLHSVAPFGEFGYRWVFSSFAIGLGPTIGLRYPVGTGFFSKNQPICREDQSCEESDSRRFEGVLHLEVGWFQ